MAGTGKGSNAVKLRHYNERLLLDCLRQHGAASKSDLARAAQLTPATAATIIDGLAAAGYVAVSGKRMGARGSPSVLYSLSPARVFAIGLKIGRDGIDGVLWDFAGGVAARLRQAYRNPAPATVQAIGHEMITAFRTQIARHHGAELAGIGLAAPYFLEAWAQELGDLGAEAAEAGAAADNAAWPAAAWAGADLQALFAQPDGLPVLVENDGAAAAQAALTLGAAGGFADVMHISLDTMVGGGLILGGRLHRGAKGNSAALGPLPVAPSTLAGARAPLGGTRLLHRASLYVLRAHLARCGCDLARDPARDEAIDITRALAELPAAARPAYAAWEEDCAAALAEAVIAIAAIIDLQAVMIDGLLPPDLQDSLMARLAAALTARDSTGLALPQLIAGRIGAQGAAIGAAGLPLAALLAPDSSVLTRGGAGNDRSARLSPR